MSEAVPSRLQPEALSPALRVIVQELLLEASHLDDLDGKVAPMLHELLA